MHSAFLLSGCAAHIADPSFPYTHISPATCGAFFSTMRYRTGTGATKTPLLGSDRVDGAPCLQPQPLASTRSSLSFGQASPNGQSGTAQELFRPLLVERIGSHRWPHTGAVRFPSFLPVRSVLSRIPCFGGSFLTLAEPTGNQAGSSLVMSAGKHRRSSCAIH